MLIQCLRSALACILPQHDVPKLSPTAQEDANFYSKWSYAWIYPLIRRGKMLPLEMTDLPQLSSSVSAANLGLRFHHVYRQLALLELGQRHPYVQQLPNSPPPSSDVPVTLPFWSSLLLRATRLMPSSYSSRTSRTVSIVSAASFLSGFLLKPLWLLFAVSQAFCIRFIIQRLSEIQSPSSTLPPSSRWVLLPAVFAMILTSTLMSFLQHAVFATSAHAGMRARAALCSQLYRKMLRLSPVSFSSATSGGNLINLMVTDTQRIVDSFQYYHFCWFGFVEISVVAGILVIDLRLSALLGIAVILILVPIQLLFATLIARSRLRITSAADIRVQQMHDILSAIRLVKYSAWESHFQAIIDKLRRDEIHHLRVSAVIRSLNNAIFLTAPILVTLVTFASHTALFRERLSSTTAFSTVAFYAILARTLNLLPYGWLSSSEGKVSTRRIDRFLDLPELPHIQDRDRLDIILQAAHFQSTVNAHGNVTSIVSTPEAPSNNGPTLRVDAACASFTYAPLSSFESGDSIPPVLSNINLRVLDGDLICVIGAVGSGKSTLLSGLIGEVRLSAGTSTVAGRIAYCAQQPWIVNGTLRHNISLFAERSGVGNDVDDDFSASHKEEWFQTVVDACCLRADMNTLPAGDQTEIGERGINLSGGQKARVALARAVYAQADVYILDDPLAAVDATICKQLIENVLGPKGLLRGKARVVATHHVALLPLARSVLILEGGAIAHMGTAEELHLQGINLEILREEANSPKRNNVGIKLKDLAKKVARENKPCAAEVEEDKLRRISELWSDGNDCPDICPEKISVEIDGSEKGKGLAGEKLVVDEDRKYGNVSWSVYYQYVKAGGGLWMAAALITMFIASQAMRTMAEVWIGIWTTNHETDPNLEENWRYLRVYLGLVVGAFTLALIRAVFFAVFTMLASRRLHDQLTARVLSARTSFFDTNPLGRILNRFGKDVDQVDMLLPIAMQDVLLIAAMLLGSVITISTIIPWLLIIMAICLTVFFMIQGIYKVSSRELKRLDGMAFSPIYALAVQTLEGNSTIRSFAFQSEFSKCYEHLVDKHHSAYLAFQMTARWLGVRLDYATSVVVGCTALGVVVLGNSMDVGLAGVALTQSLLLTGFFQWGVRQMAETENLFTSVERIEIMTRETPIEAARHIPSTKPAEDWPKDGTVSFENVVLKYRPELPPALNGINFTTRARERVGVVGRTGSGKSSILAALFRIVELTGGSICIDGVDISTLGLFDLRSRLAIVPQEANLFNGTVRSNLDPMGTCSDVQLWDALARVYMRDVVREMGKEGSENEVIVGGLDSEIRDNGGNLSLGERQLLCLARVILSGGKIVVLDEASAFLDNATDTLIQQTVRQELADRTIITVAHRLATIADYDRILVIDSGKVVEFDTPSALMSSGGYFARLVQDVDLQSTKD